MPALRKNPATAALRESPADRRASNDIVPDDPSNRTVAVGDLFKIAPTSAAMFFCASRCPWTSCTWTTGPRAPGRCPRTVPWAATTPAQSDGEGAEGPTPSRGTSNGNDASGVETPRPLRTRRAVTARCAQKPASAA
jgi:hypothetical protein